MASALVLVKSELGQAVKVAEALRKISGVKQAYAITGPYDVFAVAEGKGAEELTQLVISRIQGTHGVKDTLTCLVVG